MYKILAAPLKVQLGFPCGHSSEKLTCARDHVREKCNTVIADRKHFFNDTLPSVIYLCYCSVYKNDIKYFSHI